MFLSYWVCLSLTFFIWMFFSGSGYAFTCHAVRGFRIGDCLPLCIGTRYSYRFMVGIGKAADHHILIKDAVALEQMRKVNVVVLDKTGID